MLNGFFTHHTWVEIKVSIRREFFLKIWLKQCFQVSSTCCQGSFPHCCTVDIVYFLPASHCNISLSLPIFPMEGWELPKLIQVSQVPWGWYTYIHIYIYNFVCLSKCVCLHNFMCTTCMQEPVVARRWYQTSWIGVTEDWETLYVCAGNLSPVF